MSRCAEFPRALRLDGSYMPAPLHLLREKSAWIATANAARALTRPLTAVPAPQAADAAVKLGLLLSSMRQTLHGACAATQKKQGKSNAWGTVYQHQQSALTLRVVPFVLVIDSDAVLERPADRDAARRDNPRRDFAFALGLLANSSGGGNGATPPPLDSSWWQEMNRLHVFPHGGKK